MNEAIVRRLAEVEGAVAAARENECLAAIFQLNNEIGVAARADPAAALGLKALQGRVNSVTTAVKTGDFATAATHVGEAKALLDGLSG